MNIKIVLNFLNELANNNNREWFHAHRDMYLAAKKEVETLVNAIANPLVELDPEIAGFTDPKIAMFRIFRDIRFSPNKIPYKDHFGIFFAKGGRKVHSPGYYIHIQPEMSFACGGLWLPEPDKLKAIRQEIIYNTDTLSDIINENNFKKYFSLDDDMMLTRIPAGYPKDFPYPEYLRTKSFTFSTPLSIEDLLSVELPQIIINCFTAIHPMIVFLNEAIEN